MRLSMRRYRWLTKWCGGGPDSKNIQKTLNNDSCQVGSVERDCSGSSRRGGVWLMLQILTKPKGGGGNEYWLWGARGYNHSMWFRRLGHAGGQAFLYRTNFGEVLVTKLRWTNGVGLVAKVDRVDHQVNEDLAFPHYLHQVDHTMVNIHAMIV